MNDGTDKPYSKLGELLDTIARKRNVRGPYLVAKHITDTTGYRISGQAVSRFFYGENYPRARFIAAFADAFELTLREERELAWLYTYGEELEDESTYGELEDESQSTS